MSQTAYNCFVETIGEGSLKKLLKRLKEVNRDLETKGVRSYSKSSDYKINLLTGYAYDEFYDWDLYFENIYLSYYRQQQPRIMQYKNTTIINACGYYILNYLPF